MDSTEVVSLVEGTWRTAQPKCRLAALRSVRRLVPAEWHSLFDCLCDAKIGGVEEDSSAVVLFLIHGIQTDGAWQKVVQEEFEDISNLNVIDIGYYCVTAAQLASPFRSNPVRRVVREIRDAKRREPVARLMVIAHSFGSYVVGRVLSEHPDIEFERIVLCGSIVRRDFAWDVFAKHMARGAIINDVGTKDFYPVLATFASVGYGASGRLGFQTGAVKDRYFCYGHSDFFSKEFGHISKFWKPFIKEGVVTPSAWDTQKPKTGLLILMLSHPWIGRSLLIIAVILACLGGRAVWRLLT